MAPSLDLRLLYLLPSVHREVSFTVFVLKINLLQSRFCPIHSNEVAFNIFKLPTTS
ncbi:hypothetical protein I79_011904 [Cricetulus griseus]|uniref:Uncharacterized protein n=1 Tax=Cricetulus griseus TaxID=10029 RepID=G3HME4_CRIGR|nr:hypothetical protein I79_011904 [Cricetulus griseus]